jgi:ribonuclease HII
MGAWAGPLAVGVVILDPGKRIYKIRDSKLLDPPRRRWLAERIKERAIAWSVGLTWPDEIDAVGLTEALKRAARRALNDLGLTPDAILLDGTNNYLREEGAKTIVRGDAESISIAAASLVAKVCRDDLMTRLAPMYHPYRFEKNKGYPSPVHKWALAAFGPAPIHRRLFSPVQKLVDDGVPGRLLPAAETQISADPSGIPERHL